MPFCNGPFVNDKYLSRSSQARLSQSYFKGALHFKDYLRYLRCTDTESNSGLVMEVS